MKICDVSTLNQFKEKFGEEKTKLLIDEIQLAHNSGLSRTQVAEAVAKIADRTVVDEVFKQTQALLHEKKLVENIIFSSSEDVYRKDPMKAINDILFATHRVNEGSGQSIQNLKGFYQNKLVNNLHMAIFSRDKELYSQIHQFSPEQWIRVREQMANPSKYSDPIIQDLAAIFKHHNDTLYRMRLDAGLDVSYNEDYGFKRLYNGDKIRAAGAKEFMVDLLDRLDYKKSRIVGLHEADQIHNINSLKQLYYYLKDPTTTGLHIDNYIKNLPETDPTKTIAKSLLDIFNNWQSDETSPYVSEIFSTLLDTQENKNQYRFRSLFFRNPSDEMAFMKKYGAYEDNIFKYIQADSYRTARELAFVDKFGPKPAEGFKALVGKLKEVSKVNGLKFDESMALTKFNYANNRIQSAPRLWSEALTMEDKIVYGMDRVRELVTASIMAPSGILQAVADPASTAFTYLHKSNENVATSMWRLISSYPSAVVEAWKANPKMFITTIEASERSFGESFLHELRNNPTTALFANKMMELNGSKFFNRVSAIYNLNLISDLIRTGQLADSEIQLGRFGMGADDLHFLKQHFNLVDNIVNVDLLPDKLFENNPRGISPEQYKTKMAKAIGLFLTENKAQGSTMVGDKETFYFGGKTTDQSSLQAGMARFAAQFKLLSIKQFNDYRQLANVKAASGKGIYINKPVSYSILAGTSFAFMASAGMMYTFLKALGSNGFDFEKTKEEFFTPENFNKNLYASALRYGASVPLIDAALSSRNADQALAGIVAGPSGQLAVGVPMAVLRSTYKAVEGKDPLDKRDAKELVNTLKLGVPFQSIVNLTPWYKEKIDFQNGMAEKLDSLIEKP